MIHYSSPRCRIKINLYHYLGFIFTRRCFGVFFSCCLLRDIYVGYRLTGKNEAASIFTNAQCGAQTLRLVTPNVKWRAHWKGCEIRVLAWANAPLSIFKKFKPGASHVLSFLCIGVPELLRDRWYFSSRHYYLYLKRARERLFKLAQLKKASTADSFFHGTRLNHLNLIFHLAVLSVR